MFNIKQYKKLNKQIAILYKIMFLEGMLIDNYLINKNWIMVEYWNNNKKSTAKALRKFIKLRLNYKNESTRKNCRNEAKDYEAMKQR